MWIYSLVAPFPTVTDDVAYQDLLSTWKGVPAAPIAGHAFCWQSPLWGRSLPFGVSQLRARSESSRLRR